MRLSFCTVMEFNLHFAKNNINTMVLHFVSCRGEIDERYIRLDVTVQSC